ncbi:MAG: pyruvate, phosphate dikinase [Myxococcales bacterium]|nr:pyruvate, phosphate dikinase [Myxococcales bacterium]
MPRYVYRFGAGEADGNAGQKGLLGGKGANLAEMTALGIPVPPGFTITTEVCALAVDGETDLRTLLGSQVDAALERIAELSESAFGDRNNPLLVSVRSGAPVSMPGMMDTVLNLGLNDETVQGLAEQTGDGRFAYDCYRRFVAMYGEVVMGVRAETDGDESPFAVLLSDKKSEVGVTDDSDLSADDLRSLVTAFKIEILKRVEQPFPEDPMAQLWGAVRSVFGSWQNKRAVFYRRMHGIDSKVGTAVNIQTMVFGNMGGDCATGVAFTRNPATGHSGFFGEFLLNAQGEDVVAGVRTPENIAKLGECMPEAYEELLTVAERLERHFGDMQDLEFTIQRERLWLLQTRTGKRSGAAMVKVAVDMVAEGYIDERTAIARMDPAKLDEVLHPTIDPESKPPLIAKGLPASPGAAIGRIVFGADEAEAWAARGETVLLVRNDTSPEDIHGMKAATGVLTARGGMTSHAAVVARGMGKPCVTACRALAIDPAKKEMRIDERCFSLGDLITIDGATGEVFAGRAGLVPASIGDEFGTLMGWVDEVRRLKVRTNADSAIDARTAIAFGAEGIGLCRTEHMFFAPERILAIRQMILAQSLESRREAFAQILPMQREDFKDIFRVMQGMPVTVRLLDPPLHEFLPHTDAEIAELAKASGRTTTNVKRMITDLAEVNPMLGHRGCRLAVSWPEVYEVQARALAEAAVASLADGVPVQLEIMIPFVSVPRELEALRPLICDVVDVVLEAAEVELPYLVGTMIELPRACLVAGDIAEHADFFSFGTNDLTQTTYGLSRDDAGRFLPDYLERGLLDDDPFVRLDREGVGALIRVGVEQGRAVKTKLKVGICGEHGGEASSVEFCHREGFDYVSCSPFRVPIARVAAAQAALRGEARSK